VKKEKIEQRYKREIDAEERERQRDRDIGKQRG
jgi:hypothetical protein